MTRMMILSAPFSIGILYLLTNECTLAFQARLPLQSRQTLVYSSTLQDFDTFSTAVELCETAATAPTFEDTPFVAEAAPTGSLTLPPELSSPQTTILAPPDVPVMPIPKATDDVWTGRMLVMAASAMYGTNFPLVKLLDETLPSAVSASLRFTLAAVAVSLVVLANEDTKTLDDATKTERFDSTIRGMEVGGWYCIGYICQAMALQSVEAGKCAFFGALAVIIVPLLDAVFKRISLSSTSIAAIACAITGVGLIELGHGVSALEQGDLLSLAMAGTFAFGYWRLEDAAMKYPNMAPRITMGLSIAVALGTVGYAMLGNHWNAYDSLLFMEQLSNPVILGQLAWTGIGSTALALYLETIALKSITASELTMLMTCTSIWASVFAYFALGEVLSPMAMGGGAFILAGCIVNAMGGGANDEKMIDDDSAVR